MVAPKVEEGGHVRFIEIDPENEAWFKGESQEGIEGYFPIEWFDFSESDDRPVAMRNYDAMELTVDSGSECEVLERVGGWCLVHCGDGKGWIPQESLGS